MGDSVMMMVLLVLASFSARTRGHHPFFTSSSLARLAIRNVAAVSVQTSLFIEEASSSLGHVTSKHSWLLSKNTNDPNSGISVMET